MPPPKKKNPEPAIFESIRKPMPPPTKKMGEEKPESKVHPSRRKAKHKKRIENNGDILQVEGA
jgi:hypothetical protein